MVPKETNGAFLFGYLVEAAWKLLLGKGCWRFPAGSRYPHQSSIVPVHPAARREEGGDTCLDPGGGWHPPENSRNEERKGPLHLISRPVPCSALQMPAPPRAYTCPSEHFLLASSGPTVPHGLSPTCHPGSHHHCSPGPGLPPLCIWRRSLPFPPPPRAPTRRRLMMILAVKTPEHLLGTRWGQQFVSRTSSHLYDTVEM